MTPKNENLTVRMTVLMTETEKQYLRKIAFENGKNMSEVLREFMAFGMEKIERAEQKIQPSLRGM